MQGGWGVRSNPLYIEIEIGKGYQETEYRNLFKSSNAGKGTASAEVPSGLPHREIWDHLSNTPIPSPEANKAMGSPRNI